jgi:ribonuclease Z
MSEFIVTILGTSASMPTAKRGLPAVLIQHEGKRFLVDCGEGTQRQMMHYGGLHAPDAIFLTHYHPDHTLGLPGLFASLNSMRDEDETEDMLIPVYGPNDGIGGVKAMCQRAGGHPSFVQFRGTVNSSIAEYDGLKVTSFPTDHGTVSQGYVIEEPMRPGRIDVGLARHYGINGTAIGALQRGEYIGGVGLADISGPARRDRKVVVTGDTRPSPMTVAAAKNADLLIPRGYVFGGQQQARKAGQT